MGIYHCSHHYHYPEFNLGKYIAARLVSIITGIRPCNNFFFNQHMPYVPYPNLTNFSIFDTYANAPQFNTYSLPTPSYQFKFPQTPIYNSQQNHNLGFDSSTYFNFSKEPLTPISNQWNPFPKLTLFSNEKISNSFKYSKAVSGSINNDYSRCSKVEAEAKAINDLNLERLTGDPDYWEISEANFKTDIPFAKKGTGKILSKVSKELGIKLVITSALGTGDPNNPHIKDGYVSHHNANNPKLDIAANGNANELAKKLKATGYFSHVYAEGDHVDVQIDPEKFEEATV